MISKKTNRYHISQEKEIYTFQIKVLVGLYGIILNNTTHRFEENLQHCAYVTQPVKIDKQLSTKSVLLFVFFI